MPIATMTSQISDNELKKRKVFRLLFVAAFALMPLVAVISPRFLAFWPGVTGVVLTFLQFKFFGKKPLISKDMLFWVAGILLLAGTSSLWALDPEFTLHRTIKMALILVPGLLLIGAVRSVELALIQPALQYVVYGSAIAALLLALDMSANFPLARAVRGLDFSDEFAPATLNRAVIAVLAMSFGCYQILAKQYKQSKSALLVLPFLPFLALTESQSAQLGGVAALLCFIAFPYSRKVAWYVLAGLAIAGIMLAPFIATWMFDAFAAKVSDMPFLGKGGGYGAQRLEIWDAVARKALERPLNGFGLEAARAVEAFDISQIYQKSISLLHPHNFALQLWLEFGLLGATAGAAFFLQLFRHLQACNYLQARAAFSTLVVLLPAAVFGYGMWQSWLLGLFMFIFAFAMLVMRLYEDKG